MSKPTGREIASAIVRLVNAETKIGEVQSIALTENTKENWMAVEREANQRNVAFEVLAAMFDSLSGN